MRVLSLLVAIVVAACSGEPEEQLQLQIAAPDESTMKGDSSGIQMQAGDKLVVALVAIGAKHGPVAFLGDALPAFASLDGQLLTLSPARSEAGEYSLRLSATAGSKTVTTMLHLSVGRFNSLPSRGPFVDLGDDDDGLRIYADLR